MISEDLKPSNMITGKQVRSHGKLKQMMNSFTYRDKNFLDRYEAIIRSSLLYGITTYLREMKTLEHVQKRAIRACSHLKRGSYEARCREAKLLTVKETLDEDDMLQM